MLINNQMNSFTRYKSGEKCKIFSPLFFYCMHHDILLQHIRLYCFQLKSDQRFAKIFLVGQGESRLNFWRGQRRCPIRKRPQRIGWFLLKVVLMNQFILHPQKGSAMLCLVLLVLREFPHSPLHTTSKSQSYSDNLTRNYPFAIECALVRCLHTRLL